MSKSVLFYARNLVGTEGDLCNYMFSSVIKILEATDIAVKKITGINSINIKNSIEKELTEKELTGKQYDCILLERDYFICGNPLIKNCGDLINEIYHYLIKVKSLGITIIPDPETMRLTSTKKYINLMPEEFITGSEYLSLTDVAQESITTPGMTIRKITIDKFDFETYDTYIIKLVNTSGSKGIRANVTLDTVANELLKLEEDHHVYKLPAVIIQPQLKNFVEFKTIIIGGEIIAVLASDFDPKDLTLGSFDIELQQFNSMCYEEYSNYIKDSGQDALVTKLETKYLQHLDRIKHLALHYYYQFNSLLTDPEDYLRVDIIYDQNTENTFYLNEIEPFASGKFCSAQFFCRKEDDSLVDDSPGLKFIRKLSECLIAKIK